MTDDTGGKRPDKNSGLDAEADSDDESEKPFRLPDDTSESVRIIGPVDEPPLRFGPDDTGPLPHWTEPPTGEVPRIFAEDVGPPDDVDAWAASATQAPV